MSRVSFWFLSCLSVVTSHAMDVASSVVWGVEASSFRRNHNKMIDAMVQSAYALSHFIHNSYPLLHHAATTDLSQFAVSTDSNFLVHSSNPSLRLTLQPPSDSDLKPDSSWTVVPNNVLSQLSADTKVMVQNQLGQLMARLQDAMMPYTLSAAEDLPEHDSNASPHTELLPLPALTYHPLSPSRIMNWLRFLSHEETSAIIRQMDATLGLLARMVFNTNIFACLPKQLSLSIPQDPSTPADQILQAYLTQTDWTHDSYALGYGRQKAFNILTHALNSQQSSSDDPTTQMNALIEHYAETIHCSLKRFQLLTLVATVQKRWQIFTTSSPLVLGTLHLDSTIAQHIQDLVSPCVQDVEAYHMTLQHIQSFEGFFDDIFRKKGNHSSDPHLVFDSLFGQALHTDLVEFRIHDLTPQQSQELLEKMKFLVNLHAPHWNETLVDL